VLSIESESTFRSNTSLPSSGPENERSKETLLACCLLRAGLLSYSLTLKTEASVSPKLWFHGLHGVIYSETCIKRNRMGPKIFSTFDKFPHYTKLQKKKC
jgi:hypothetical protein